MNSEIENLLEEMIHHQYKKTLEIARLTLPHLTGDDILNPNDFPELMSNPIFNYEEGIMTGLMTAQAAIRAYLQKNKSDSESNPESNHDHP